MRTDTERRTFLLGLAGAATSLHGADQQIQAGMVGIGKRGTELLKQVLAQASVKVTAVCDTDPHARDTAQSMAARDNPKAFTDYRKLVDDKSVDVVVVATPCYLHAEMAATALDAGKYVYCEKPLGITPEQVDLAVRAAKRSKAFLQIGQQLRYFPGLRRMIDAVHKEGVIGRPLVIKAQRHSTPVPVEAQRARPDWYKDVKRSGDLIVENSVHNLDVCNWVAASRPESAYGHGKRYFPDPIPAGTQMMDGFSVEYIYDNDMHLDYSQLYMHPRALKMLPNNQWYLIFGQKGTLDLSNGTLYPLEGSEETRQLLTPEEKVEKENAMSEFFACIREKRAPYADINVAATAALTAILGREAIYRRRSVSWKELGVAI